MNSVTVSPWKMAHMLSVVGFILLFAGFLFYHMLVASSLMPPFLGGFFGVISALTGMLFLLLLPFIFSSLVKKINLFILFVLGFFVFVTFWSGIHEIILGDEYIKETFIQSLRTVALWFPIFFIGVFLPHESFVIRRMFLLSIFIIFSILIVYVAYTGKVKFNTRLFVNSEIVTASYQGYARSALIILLFLIAEFKNISSRYFFFLIGFFILFVIGARSEFFAFLSVSVLLTMILSIKNVKYFFVGIFIFIFLSVVVGNTVDSLSKSRQFQVFDLSSASSWIARQDLQQVAIGQIASEPVLGHFGGHISYWGSSSKYAHNALSAWVNYGLLGFLWFLGLTLTAFGDSLFRILILGRRDNAWVLALSLNFVCLLLIVVAKSVFWVVPALAWGVYVRAQLYDFNIKKLAAINRVLKEP